MRKLPNWKSNSNTQARGDQISNISTKLMTNPIEGKYPRIIKRLYFLKKVSNIFLFEGKTVTLGEFIENRSFPIWDEIYPNMTYIQNLSRNGARYL